MSVGGRVVEVVRLADRLWVNTSEPGTGDQCAVYVKRFAEDGWLTPGDSLWWQSNWAYWTPQTRECRDVRVERIGYSGAERPSVGENVKEGE